MRKYVKFINNFDIVSQRISSNKGCERFFRYHDFESDNNISFIDDYSY
jgi:hypothetical protein